MSFTTTMQVSPVVATVLIVVLNFAAIRPSTGFGHEIKFGRCPNVGVVEEFDFELFTGLWYVIERTNVISKCVTFDFFQDGGGMKVRMSGKPFGISVPFAKNNVLSRVGDLRIPNSEEPGKMKMAYFRTLKPFLEKDFRIMDTDYTTYAAIFSCFSMGITHTEAGIILSREPTLDREKINELRARFEYFGVNKNKLGLVDHENCGPQ